jgi:hypothetical protein
MLLGRAALGEVGPFPLGDEFLRRHDNPGNEEIVNRLCFASQPDFSLLERVSPVLQEWS